MRAGALKHRIVVEQPVATPDAALGGSTVVWTTYVERWASIASVTGRESFLAQQTVSQASHVVRMRYTPGVTPKMRIRFAGRLFNVEAMLNPDFQNRESVLLVSEVLQ